METLRISVLILFDNILMIGLSIFTITASQIQSSAKYSWLQDCKQTFSDLNYIEKFNI